MAEVYIRFETSHAEYLQMARTYAEEHGSCLTRKVGCLIRTGVGTVQAFMGLGANGMFPDGRSCLSGDCHRCNERVNGKLATGMGLSICYCVHAEVNAVRNAVMCSQLSGSGHIAYCTVRPCNECTKLLATMGCARVYYADDYASGSLEIASMPIIKVQ